MADYEKQLKKLLSNKKSMGGDKYAAAIGKLKKDMKANNAGSFKKLLNNVKKQEREGQFDRGAEGETKKKLRAKMAAEPKTQFTRGMHKGSDKDIVHQKGYEHPLGVAQLSQEGKIDVSKGLAGETDKQRKARKETKKRKQTPGHSR
tara:strand:+ start:179 stop:619 length:441 start_codon:yes stop_codon:yes gene_type:complete